MSIDRSTRSVLAAILATAAAIIGVNLIIRPEGLSDNMGPLFLLLLGLAIVLWAWNWREAYAESHPAVGEDDEPAAQLTGDPDAPSGAIAPSLSPVVSAPPVSLAPEAVMPPAPAPTPGAPAVPAPEPVTPPVPEPVEPSVPEPVEPDVPEPAPQPSAPSQDPRDNPLAHTIKADEPAVPGPATAQAKPRTEEASPKTVRAAKAGSKEANAVVAESMAAPVSPDPRKAGKKSAAKDKPAPDDLTRIEGIGKYYNDALHAVGIQTFAQLAAETPDAILSRLLAAGYRRHPTIPTWPEQAKLAAKGDWDGLSRLQATLISGRRA